MLHIIKSNEADKGRVRINTPMIRRDCLFNFVGNLNIHCINTILGHMFFLRNQKMEGRKRFTIFIRKYSRMSMALTDLEPLNYVKDGLKSEMLS